MVKAKIAVKSKILFMIVILNTNYGLKTWKINGSFFFRREWLLWYSGERWTETKLQSSTENSVLFGACENGVCACQHIQNKYSQFTEMWHYLSKKYIYVSKWMYVCMFGCVRLLSVRLSIGCHRNMIH